MKYLLYVFSIGFLLTSCGKSPQEEQAYQAIKNEIYTINSQIAMAEYYKDAYTKEFYKSSKEKDNYNITLYYYDRIDDKDREIKKLTSRLNDLKYQLSQL